MAILISHVQGYLLRFHFIELKNISCFNFFYTVDVTFLVTRFWFYKLKNVMIGLFSVLFEFSLPLL